MLPYIISNKYIGVAKLLSSSLWLFFKAKNLNICDIYHTFSQFNIKASWFFQNDLNVDFRNLKLIKMLNEIEYLFQLSQIAFFNYNMLIFVFLMKHLRNNKLTFNLLVLYQVSSIDNTIKTLGKLDLVKKYKNLT